MRWSLVHTKYLAASHGGWCWVLSWSLVLVFGEEVVGALCYADHNDSGLRAVSTSTLPLDGFVASVQLASPRLPGWGLMPAPLTKSTAGMPPPERNAPSLVAWELPGLEPSPTAHPQERHRLLEASNRADAPYLGLA